MLLHPVRMRVIQQLLLGKPMTILQLVERLGDVPQATLYRHMKVLEEEEVVKVVATNKVYNREERVYSVVVEQLEIPQTELENATAEDQLYYFTVYHSNLLQQVSTYLNQASAKNYMQDGFGYVETPLHLTDEQFQEFAAEFNEVLLKYVNIQPSENSRTRTLATIMIPQPPFRTEPEKVRENEDKKEGKGR